MRIAGYIEHPKLKITIFQMDNRFTVKFEDGTLEQAYKFRSGNFINSVGDIRKLVDATFIQEVTAEMARLYRIHKGALERLQPEEEEDEFESELGEDFLGVAPATTATTAAKHWLLSGVQLEEDEEVDAGEDVEEEVEEDWGWI